MKVLFVCSGNTCRSPMAKAVLEHFASRTEGLEDLVVDSAGISAYNEKLATREAIDVVQELLGVDISAHTAKRVTADLVNTSDLVLCMTRLHKEDVLRLVPSSKDKVFLLGDYAGTGEEVHDPIGSGLEGYRACVKQLAAMMQTVVKRIKGTAI